MSASKRLQQLHKHQQQYGDNTAAIIPLSKGPHEYGSKMGDAAAGRRQGQQNKSVPTINSLVTSAASITHTGRSVVPLSSAMRPSTVSRSAVSPSRVARSRRVSVTFADQVEKNAAQKNANSSPPSTETPQQAVNSPSTSTDKPTKPAEKNLSSTAKIPAIAKVEAKTADNKKQPPMKPNLGNSLGSSRPRVRSQKRPSTSSNVKPPARPPSRNNLGSKTRPKLSSSSSARSLSSNRNQRRRLLLKPESKRLLTQSGRKLRQHESDGESEDEDLDTLKATIRRWLQPFQSKLDQLQDKQFLDDDHIVVAQGAWTTRPGANPDDDNKSASSDSSSDLQLGDYDIFDNMTHPPVATSGRRQSRVKIEHLDDDDDDDEDNNHNNYPNQDRRMLFYSRPVEMIFVSTREFDHDKVDQARKEIRAKALEVAATKKSQEGSQLDKQIEESRKEEEELQTEYHAILHRQAQFMMQQRNQRKHFLPVTPASALEYKQWKLRQSQVSAAALKFEKNQLSIQTVSHDIKMHQLQQEGRLLAEMLWNVEYFLMELPGKMPDRYRGVLDLLARTRLLYQDQLELLQKQKSGQEGKDDEMLAIPQQNLPKKNGKVRPVDEFLKFVGMAIPTDEEKRKKKEEEKRRRLQKIQTLKSQVKTLHSQVDDTLDSVHQLKRTLKHQARRKQVQDKRIDALLYKMQCMGANLPPNIAMQLQNQRLYSSTLQRGASDLSDNSSGRMTMMKEKTRRDLMRGMERDEDQSELLNSGRDRQRRHHNHDRPWRRVFGFRSRELQHDRDEEGEDVVDDEFKSAALLVDAPIPTAILTI